MAPAELITNRVEASTWSPPARASASGRAMASPTRLIVLTRSLSTRRQTSTGSKWGISTTVPPMKKLMKLPSWAAPCMSGGIGNVTSTPAAAARGATSSGRCARRAACVDDVQVVACAAPEASTGGTLSQHRFELHGTRRRLGVAVVVDEDEVPEPGSATHLGDAGAERLLVDQPDEVAVPEKRAELPGHVSVVDVDRYRPDLERGQHALDVLGPVVEQDADVVAWRDAHPQQMVGKPVGALVELGVRQPAIAADQCQAVGDGVDDALEQVGQVEVHRQELTPLPGWAGHRRRSSCPGGATAQSLLPG